MGGLPRLAKRELVLKVVSARKRGKKPSLKDRFPHPYNLDPVLETLFVSIVANPIIINKTMLQELRIRKEREAEFIEITSRILGTYQRRRRYERRNVKNVRTALTAFRNSTFDFLEKLEHVYFRKDPKNSDFVVASNMLAQASYYAMCMSELSKRSAKRQQKEWKADSELPQFGDPEEIQLSKIDKRIIPEGRAVLQAMWIPENVAIREEIVGLLLAFVEASHLALNSQQPLPNRRKNEVAIWLAKRLKYAYEWGTQEAAVRGTKNPFANYAKWAFKAVGESDSPSVYHLLAQVASPPPKRLNASDRLSKVRARNSAELERAFRRMADKS
jgi:hypothetical protein